MAKIMLPSSAKIGISGSDPGVLHHDVLGFEVTVDHAFRVGCIEAAANLLDDPCGFFRRQLSWFGLNVFQITPRFLFSQKVSQAAQDQLHGRVSGEILDVSPPEASSYAAGIIQRRVIILGRGSALRRPVRVILTEGPPELLAGDPIPQFPYTNLLFREFPPQGQHHPIEEDPHRSLLLVERN